MWYKNDSMPWILETAEEICNYEVRTEAACEAGIYCVSDWPEFEPYKALINKYKDGDAPVYVTSHDTCYSIYMPDKKKILFEDK